MREVGWAGVYLHLRGGLLTPEGMVVGEVYLQLRGGWVGQSLPTPEGGGGGRSLFTPEGGGGRSLPTPLPVVIKTFESENELKCDNRFHNFS